MNSQSKYEQDKEQEEFFEQQSKSHPKEAIYYLHRRLRQKDIPYSSRKQIVFVSPDETKDEHVLKLLKLHNYTVQTIIK